MMSRDPFQPVSAAHCSRNRIMQHGRLKGVIGSGKAWIGWLAQSETRWQRLTPGALIQPENWRVSRLDKSGATLAAVDETERCDGVPAEVALPSPFINNGVAQ
ncbi:HofP DNA utilization family protein [Brenneria goodwinii]